MADPHREEIAKLESLYANNPEGRVFTHLAEAYRKSGDLERARSILQDGLRRHSDYSSAHVVLGRVLADMGQTDAAADAFRRVLELDRHNLVALRSLGEITMSGGRIDEALQYYRELQTLDPSDDRIRAIVRTLEERQTEAPAASAGAAGTTRTAADEAPHDEARFQPPRLQVQPTWTGGGEATEEAPEAEQAEETGQAVEAFEARPPGPFGALDEAGRGDATATPEPDMAGPEPDDVAGLETGWGDATDEADDAAARSENWEEDVGIELEALPGDLGALQDRPAGAAGAGDVATTDADADEWMDDAAVLDLGQAEPEAGVEPEPALSFGLDEGTGGFALDPALAPPDAGRTDDREPDADDFDATFGTSLTAAGTPDDAPARDEPEADAEDAGGREGDGLVTETMAELYFAQGFYDRAAEVYRSLLRRRPGDGRLADRLREAVAMARPPAPDAPAEVEAGDTWLEGIESAWTGGGGVAGGETTPYAWAEQRTDEEPAGPAIGEFFRSLLAWTPGTATAGTDTAASAVDTEAPAAPPEMDLTEMDLAYDDGAETGRTAVEPPDLPEAASVAGADEEAPENDEDLEMFRSWLQSLKK